MSKGLFVSVSGWSDTSLTVTVGADSEAYVPTTDKDTPYGYMEDLETWCNAAARAWSGSATFSQSLLETLTPYLGTQLTSSVATTYAADSDLQTLLGWPASGQSATEIYSSSGVPSSCDGRSDVGNWTRRVRDVGNYARSGSFVIDSQYCALRHPQIELVITEAQAGALKDALKNSSDPRTAHAYRHSTKEWVEFSLGKVDVTRSQAEHYRAALEAIG